MFRKLNEIKEKLEARKLAASIKAAIEYTHKYPGQIMMCDIDMEKAFKYKAKYPEYFKMESK